ncbi:MAG TPA: glutamate--tRNA ligase family protein [Candidatus Polarisedimenticolia bacterium]|nr:glutamate--tRNA ligase family protein [Candidatus Polarisedimenticolia bacterium]
MVKPPINQYRGRLAPSPTGYLHLGHARTFWVAWQRARAAHGKLIFRNEDLDYQRCKPEFVRAMYEDLHWLGLDWDEGPDLSFQSGNSGQPGKPGLGGTVGDAVSRSSVSHGGTGHDGFGPYSQSERRSFYLNAWHKLRDSGLIYPCTCSRKDLERALSAPHEETANDGGAQAPSPAFAQGPVAQPGAAAILSAADDELPYPGTCRDKIGTANDYDSPAGVSWRFKIPDGEPIAFDDGNFGRQEFVAGRDFADFLLWRRDDIPAYQLAVVVDDDAMQITEVVRGADLLKSTARQLLLIRALEYPVPAFFHCPLLRDEKNVRLAKRHDALSLRKLREQGVQAEELRKRFEEEMKSLSLKEWPSSR